MSAGGTAHHSSPGEAIGVRGAVAAVFTAACAVQRTACEGQSLQLPRRCKCGVRDSEPRWPVVTAARK